MRHGASGGIGYRDEDMGNGTWRVPERARRPRGMDPASRKLALIAAGVGGAVMLSVGLWSAMGHRNAVVPVIQADSRPIRVKPENAGGMQINGTNDEILSGDAGPASSRLAPPAETPEPNVLRARQEEPASPAQPVNLATPIPSMAAPPGAGAAMEAPPAIQDPPEKRAVAATPASPQAGLAKTTQVQLAALGSEAAARAEWANLTRRFPDLLGNHQPSFSKTERNGKMFWRVRTGGFADMAQATGFCERARAKGATCSIASF